MKKKKGEKKMKKSEREIQISIQEMDSHQQDNSYQFANWSSQKMSLSTLSVIFICRNATKCNIIIHYKMIL